MTLPELLLGVMFVGLIAYALFGGADFGAGIWDLLAGGTKRGARHRELIEHSIAPVWEANHVWLIFVLVVLWTAFSTGFAAVVTTLYIPLTLAAFGMIARGAAFAFRKSISGLAARRFFGACFALSSLATPFFLGTVVGGVASSRVPPGIATGDVVTSWLNPTSILGGVLAVTVCAYLASVYLVFDARRLVEPDMVEYFRRRAIGMAIVAGVVATIGIFVLRDDSRYLFDGLTSRALPLVIVSALCGVGSLLLLLRNAPRGARLLAIGAVATVVLGWGVAQWDYILPKTLTVSQAAAPDATLVTILVVFVVAAIVILPAIGLLYLLDQKNLLEPDPE
jgi:cytochrome d ubiquinol oxidase subunit II